ncbi:MAG: tetratricopeptide repeat protein [Bacteroidota bacterium]
MSKRKAKQVRQSKFTKTTPNERFPAWWTNVPLQSGLLFLFCCLLYANTFTHGYTQDDAIVIYDNMFTTQGAAGWNGILQYDTFYGFFKEEGKANLVAGGRYRPLTLLMFATEWQLFGDNPTVGHIMNVLWYAFTCVMLYWLILRCLRTRKQQGFVYFIAFSATLLFAAHPLHTEAVANIKGRDEIITLLGSIAALYCSFRAYDDKKTLWAILAGFIFFLGLMSKENAITFLAVVPLSFFVFRAAHVKEMAKQLLPFVAASIVFLAIRTSILGFDVGANVLELMNNPFVKIENGRWVAFSTGERLATILYTLGKYVQLLIFPHPLTHDYYPRHIAIMRFSDWQVLFSIVLYLGMGIYALLRLPKRDLVSYGILFFFITLSIVSNIVFPIGTNMSERFMFMPSVGFCLVVAALLWRLAQQLQEGKKILRPSQLQIALGALALIIGLFSVKTFSRNWVWESNYTLFLTDVETAPNSAKLRNAAGGELFTQAAKVKDETKREKMLKEAADHLRAAVEIHPTYKNAYLLLGNVHNYLRNYEVSVDSYKKALRLDPDFQDAINNLAITYTNAGQYHGEVRHDTEKALSYLNEAIQMRPNDVETLRLLGIAHGIKGETNKTIQYLNRALKFAPNNASILFNLGAAYYQLGDEVKGADYIAEAQAIDPSIGQAR